MSRTRLISPDFFLHAGLGGCSPHARLLFISLWTQADREGRLRWIPMKVHGETFPYEPGVFIDALAQELQEAGVLDCYQAGDRRYVHLPGFSRWQKPHKNETPSRLPAPPESVARDNVATGSGQCREALAETETHILDPDPKYLDPDPGPTSPKKKEPKKREPKKRGVKLEPPTGSDTLDYLLSQWDGLLGSHESIRGWLEASEAAYPGVDLLADAKRARAWQLGKPAQRTKKNIRSFLTGWWGRTQDSAASRGGGGSTGRAQESDDERLGRIFGGGV